MQRLTTLSDVALLGELHVIVISHRRVTAELVLYLAEVDARRLHVDKGFPSLFSYCVEQLHFSEDEACRRIEAARPVRRFPAIHPLLETGAVSLSVLGLLKPHLSTDNHRELLAGVSGSTVRRAKEWLATRFPQPDVPWSIRKRPQPSAIAPSPAASRNGFGAPPATTRIESVAPSPAASRNGFGAPPATTRIESDAPPATTRIESDAPPATTRIESDAPPGSPDVPMGPGAAPVSSRIGSDAPGLARPPMQERARVEPLSQDRFLVKFTASRAMRDKLDLASDLMRHSTPKGEISVVLERALDVLIAELEKKKQGRTDRPRKRPRPSQDTHMARATRREVVGRDGWRCSFVAEDGRRCNAPGFLEFDHEIPKGCGGSSEAANLRLLCRPHNRWAAERAYGKAYVLRAISASRSKT